ncbi:MFS transporter [Parafrigoribacterium mesophilum]|uniref:MFS transporter n=1 Tax=Parafrigoribacterium mesophilum TaxID=433646 RepID=UPI0031FBE962
MTGSERRLPALAGRSKPSGWALGALSAGQVVGWGILYYAPIVAAPAVAQDTGWTLPLTMAAISAGLVVSALSGILVGRLIDRWSPRAVMSWGSIVGTAGLAAAAFAQNLVWFFAAWLVVGIAQSGVLYQAAFAVVTRRYGARRYGALTILTLAGGLSSTVFAPITAALLGVWGWRDTLMILAGVLLVVTLPLHWFTLEKRWASEAKRGDPPIAYNVSAVIRTRQFWMLTVAMALLTLSLFSVTLAMIPLLMEKGVSYSTAALALGLVGAGQVVGRLLFFVAPHGRRPWVPIAVVAAVSVVLLAGIGLIPGPLWLLIVVAVLAGAVRGSHTLIQASAVADRWGTQNYGAINGAFSAPITVLMALSPALGPIIATGFGSYSVMALVMGALGLVALVIARGS